MNVLSAFAAAERVAPLPTRPDAAPADWVKHYAGQALAAWTVFRAAEPSPMQGVLSALGVAAMHAAVAMDSHAWTVGDLYSLTPELGALNGEWEEWVVARLDELGVNPADICAAYNTADFRTPSAAVGA